jgi:hypothetical protein
VIECPNCSIALTSGKAQYCPRCGAALPTRAGVSSGAPKATHADRSVETQTGNVAKGGPNSPPPVPKGTHLPAAAIGQPKALDASLGTAPSAKPILVEKRGTLLNPFVIGSIAMVVGGALLAGEGHLRAGILLLAIGLPSLLISTLWSLVR